MAAIDLRFGGALNNTHPVDLRFGAEDGVSPSDANIVLNVILPAPVLSGVIQAVDVHNIVVSAVLPPPTMLAVVEYDNAVYRGPNGITPSGWQVAGRMGAQRETKTQLTVKMPVVVEQPWQRAAKLRSSTQVAIQNAVPLHDAQSAHWENAKYVGRSTGGAYQSMIRLRNQRSAVWQKAENAGTHTGNRWQDRFRRPRPSLDTRWAMARSIGTDRTTTSAVAIPMLLGWQGTWQIARRPPPGLFSIPVPPTEQPGYPPPAGGAVHLLFQDALDRIPNLLFTHGRIGPQPVVIVPVRRTYIVINDSHLRRVDGNIELPTYSMSLKIDWESWTWGFDATLPAHVLASLQRTDPKAPVELEATVNGQQYRLLAENISRSRTFGKASLTVSGRGKSAVLDAPFSPALNYSNSQARTARQLMEDALMTNGVTLGWAVDWRITDWLVPAGAWNHSGSYMSAVTAIAEAAGAFIQPDPTAQTLRVRPRYIKPFWDWGSVVPDLELPSSVVTVEGVKWIDKPEYNAVYLSGTTQGGILGSVKRAGTAGDLVAPMIADALITNAIAARQRGIYVLSDTGRMADYSLSLPVLPETGVIEPGTFVRYVDNGNPVTGVVKGLSLNVTFPTVRQTIEVVTHA